MTLLGSLGRPLDGRAGGWLGPLWVAGAEAGAVCVVDGRPEGLPALASRLRADPAAPAEELIARAYDELGDEVFGLLRGRWVVVVWSPGRATGAVARDRHGDQPLHFARRGDGLVFGSEVADVVDLLPARPDPDGAWVVNFLGRTIGPAELTPYAGVSRLPAGQFIRVYGRRASVSRWWRPCQPASLELTRTEAVDALRAAATAAVERTLRGAAAPGVLLSGGFDSAAVAACAVRGRPREVRAYSGLFPRHHQVDESERILVLCNGLQLDGAVQRLIRPAALRATFEFTRRFGVPPASPNVYLWSGLTARAAADGVDLLLDGAGGDELFGCSPNLLADLLRGGRIGRMLALARRVPGMGHDPPRRWIGRALVQYAVRGAAPPSLHALLRRARRREPLRPPWLAAALRQAVGDADADAWKRRPGDRWWAALAHATGAGEDAIGAADQYRREAQLAGLRRAHPWRDGELADLVMRLPPELAFDPVLDRPLARAAMDGLVPDAVRLSTAKPHFNDPLRDALTGADRPLVSELASAPELAPYVDADGVDRLLRSDARAPGWPLDVWRLVALAGWLRGQADAEALERLEVRAPEPELDIRPVRQDD